MSKSETIIFCLLVLYHNILDPFLILCKHMNFVNKPVSVNKLVCLFFQRSTYNYLKNHVTILFVETLFQLVECWEVSKVWKTVIEMNPILKVLIFFHSWLEPNESHLWVHDCHMNVFDFIKHEVVIECVYVRVEEYWWCIGNFWSHEFRLLFRWKNLACLEVAHLS